MSERLHRALEFCVCAHAGQDRDGEVAPPYACHPIEVMLNLRYVGGVSDEDLLIVALLHDTLEETVTQESEVRKAFGTRVGDLVRALTRQEPEPSALVGLSKDEIWKVRSDLLLDEIARMSPDAQVVKLADRLSNVREARLAKSPAKFKRYLGHTEKVLKLIPRKRNPALWEAIRVQVDKPSGQPN
ncbi:MAG TPA: HD domain-containing protein [Fimbriimonadaceae bacterium]|nr:HD domain-containing protein [Fimbriimonadaceae bacterium]